MKVVLLFILVAAAVAPPPPRKESALKLKAVLRSPAAAIKLYNEFKSEQHLEFSPSEDRLRFRIFRNNADFVANENLVDDETAEFAINMFTTMTEAEKHSWLGLNVTGHNPHIDIPLVSKRSLSSIPAEKLWTNEGKVTAVKNQKSCGSCWSFGAVGGLETRYANAAGVLRSFSEQEYLDCVYEGERDGCNGGWPDSCYSYSNKNGGRLASNANYGYTQRDGICQGSSKPDAMVAAKITGAVGVSASEQANIVALAEGSLSVAFEVTNRFQTYSKGIFKDTTCYGNPNHAVTAVGYTSTFVLVKNSWGRSWGDQGFVKFARNHHNCHLWNYSSYPRLSITGSTDNGGDDAATDYNADDDSGPAPEPDCEDSYSPCYESWCKYDWIVEDYCQKTCGNCGGSDTCPSGTIKCPDGVCRHEHMC